MQFLSITSFFRKSLPVILQAEAAECGLACVAMIVNYHGFKIDMISIRKRFEVSSNGMSLKDIIVLGEKLNMTSSPVKIELEELRSLSLPCILHWSFNHFVVLKKLSRNGGIIHDPSIGERSISHSELSSCFTGIVLEMSPSAKFEKIEKSTMLTLKYMLAGIEGKTSVLAKVIIFSAAIEIMTLLIPASSQFILDNILNTGNLVALNIISSFIIIMIFVRMLFTWFRDWNITATKYTIGLTWSESFLNKLISLPVVYYKKRYLGDVVSRLQSLNEIQEAFTARMISAILDAIITVFLLLFMGFYSVTLCMIIVFIALIYALIKWAFFGMYKMALIESINKTAGQSSHFIETVRGISTIKMLSLSTNRKIKWLRLSTESISANIKIFHIELIFRLIGGCMTGLVACTVIYGGAQLIENGLFTMGILFAFMVYADTFIQRTINVCDVIYEFKMLTIHTDRLSDVFFTESEYSETNYIEDVSENFEGTLEISSLSFAYSNYEPFIFKNVSFTIEQGESVAFVGVSGCGKSTLLHVIASLLTPTKGEIRFSKTPMSNIGIEVYRKYISYVQQDDFLLSGTLMDNITCFSEQVDIEFMYDCAKIASIHDDIVNMPNGYSSMVGDMGSMLSGGQKQRIFLARALYRKPKILILDESTSALDIKNERNINAAIKAMKITRLFAAHRLDAISVADRVFDMTTGIMMTPQEYLYSLKVNNGSYI